MEDVHAYMREVYDRAAPTYDTAGFHHYAPFGERLAQLILLGPGGRVLDVACGIGAALLPAARRVGASGEAVGIDVAPGMLERARVAAAEEDLAQVRLEHMDAARLEFGDGAFDAVLCAFGLSALENPDAALAEFRRVLAPTGTLGVSVWENLEDVGWTWERELMNEFVHEVPAELLAAVGEMSSRFNEAEKLRGGLESAGFRDVKVERMDIERTYDGPEAWWAWILSHGSRAFVESLSEESRERFRAEGFERVGRMGRRERSRRFVALLATARPAG